MDDIDKQLLGEQSDNEDHPTMTGEGTAADPSNKINNNGFHPINAKAGTLVKVDSEGNEISEQVSAGSPSTYITIIAHHRGHLQLLGYLLLLSMSTIIPAKCYKVEHLLQEINSSRPSEGERLKIIYPLIHPPFHITNFVTSKKRFS